MTQNASRNSAGAGIIKNDGSNPELIQPQRTTARNGGDGFFESPLKLIGEGILTGKSFNESAENDANTKVEEQEALKNPDAENGEKRISSETEPFVANKTAQKLYRKRKFSEVEGASDVEEHVAKRRRLSSYTPSTK
jgi:hypothetical protein